MNDNGGGIWFGVILGGICMIVVLMLVGLFDVNRAARIVNRETQRFHQQAVDHGYGEWYVEDGIVHFQWIEPPEQEPTP